MPEQHTGRRSSHRSTTTTRSSALTANAPWAPPIVLGWAGVTVAAAVVLIVSWYSASGDYTFDQQKTSLNVAILAVVLANVAGAAVLITGRRAVGLRRLQLLTDMPASLARKQSAGAVLIELDSTLLVGGAGLTHYHRMGCQMALGRDWLEATRVSHEEEGRRPCGVCRP
jgi:hypothetical protein